MNIDEKIENFFNETFNKYKVPRRKQKQYDTISFKYKNKDFDLNDFLPIFKKMNALDKERLIYYKNVPEQILKMLLSEKSYEINYQAIFRVKLEIDEWQFIKKLLFESLYNIDSLNSNERDFRSFTAKKCLIYMSDSPLCPDYILLEIYNTFLPIKSIGCPYDTKHFYSYVRKIKSASSANMKLRGLIKE